MKILNWLNKNFEEAILITLLIVMTLVMGGQVCTRYLLNASMSWTEELTRYLFVWSGFLSISFAAEKSIAIRLEQLSEKMSEKAKSILFIIDYMIEFLFFGCLIPEAGRLLAKVYTSGRASTAMGMPMWILQAAPVIGFLLVEFRLIQKIYYECQKLRGGDRCKQ